MHKVIEYRNYHEKRQRPDLSRPLPYRASTRNFRSSVSKKAVSGIAQLQNISDAASSKAFSGRQNIQIEPNRMVIRPPARQHSSV
jgi:hypothetical protein